jgi:hypothetical protein
MTRRLDFSRREEAHDAFAAQIYGLLVVGAALAVARPGAQSRWSVSLDVFTAALVYSLAHIYADLVDRGVHRAHELTRTERRAIMANGLAILRATGAPFLTLLVCSGFGAPTSISVNVALGVLVGELAVTSWIAGAAIQPSLRRFAYSVAATLLGGLLIALKIATH